MRAPFPSENNVLLIRNLLVPDPLSEGEWTALLEAWRAAKPGHSLLEWVAARHTDGSDPVLRAMEAATGAEWRDWPGPGEKEAGTAEEDLLERHGFVFLGKEGHRGIVAGGPDFPPDLQGYLGKAAAGYTWIMISPLRKQAAYRPSGEAVETVAEEAGGMAGMVGELLRAAVADRASDIHFEAFGARFIGRVRQGGRMRSLGKWSGGEGHEILRILKRWANFSTAASPLPQDGRIEIPSAGGTTAFRASHVWAENGESMVLRLTGSRSRIPPMSELGVPGDLSWKIKDMLLHQSGLILFTGATCSGKTTTACALLSSLAGERVKILSIEDPVEYEIPHVVQCSVRPGAGWTFGNALRAFLRAAQVQGRELVDGRFGDAERRLGGVARCGDWHTGRSAADDFDARVNM